ncbi:restriction endonuclease subunit S [Acinetobacter baumannii]
MEKQKCPEVRFKGYDQNWRLKKLEAIGIFNPYSNLPQEFEYVDLESVVGTELINSRKETIETAPSRAQRLASRGDVFYQAVRPYQKNNYLFDLPYDNYVFSTGYIQIRPTINSYYLLSIVQKNDFVQKVLENCTGTSYPAINTTGLKSIDVFISNEANEQTQIGNFFQNLDQSIALQEKKLTQTQNLKKAMLEKMFPKAGSKQPEIRLKGFSGDWEKKLLQDEVEFFSGLTYSPDDLTNKNGTLVLRSSNVQNNQICTDDNVYVVHDAVNVCNVEVGDIIVVVRNGSRSLIGKHAVINKQMKNTVIGAFMTGVKAKNPYFINALFDTSLFDLAVSRNLGATINQITTGMFKQMEFKFPDKTEQIAIGQFFKKIDETLVLQQQQLQTLKNLKQAFLGKMFV